MASPLKQEDAGKFEQSYQAHPKEHAAEEDKLEPIAVTGLALRFPQDATSPQAFWEMLLQGRSAMTEVPKDRWNIDAFYHPNPERHDSVSLTKLSYLQGTVAASLLMIADERQRGTFPEGRHRGLRCTVLLLASRRSRVYGSSATRLAGMHLSCPRER